MGISNTATDNIAAARYDSLPLRHLESIPGYHFMTLDALVGDDASSARIQKVNRFVTTGHRFAIRNLWMCILGLLLPAWPTSTIAADPFPVKPVRIVVSYAPGNLTDILARIVAEKLAENWKQPVIIDNRAGLGGSIGAQIVAKAPPDGYTQLFSAMAAFAINPHVYPNLGYDPIANFTPIIGIAYPQSSLLFANTALKAGSLQELIQYSKANPGALNYGSAGSGTAPHLNMEALKMQTGLIAEHIPYKGAVAAMSDLIGGRIQLQQESLGVSLPQIRAGKIKPIVSFSNRRLPQLPDLPAITEVLPTFEPVRAWLGILGPANMPREIIDQVHKAADSVIRQPAMVEKLQANGMSPLGATPEEFRILIARDFERLGKLSRELKLKVD